MNDKIKNLPKEFQAFYIQEHTANRKLRYEYIEELINENKCAKVAELGCGEGFPTLYLLENCPSIEEFIGVDPGRAHIPFYHKEFESYNKGRYIPLKAIDAAKQFEDNYFDLVWMDQLSMIFDFLKPEADRRISKDNLDRNLEVLINDIVVWLGKVKVGGILCGRDYGTIQFPNVTRAVDSVFEENKTLLPEYQGTFWFVTKK